MWAFIVWVKKLGKHIKTAWQCILRVILRHGLVTRCLLTLDSSTFSMCFSHDLSQVIHSQASREVLCSSQFFTKLSYSTLTLNLTNIKGIDWLNTIKFDTELIPTKYNWKLQLYNPPLWLFRDRNPKQTLDLKHEFGKTHSNLNLKPVKNL